MVTFDDLPFEIRYMIIEEALPDIPEQGWRSPASCSKHEKEFRRSVLRIATTSRSLLTIVYDVFELLDQQDFRIPAIRTKSTSHVVYLGTKGSVNRWYFVLRTLVSLRFVVRSHASGVTLP